MSPYKSKHTIIQWTTSCIIKSIGNYTINYYISYIYIYISTQKKTKKTTPPPNKKKKKKKHPNPLPTLPFQPPNLPASATSSGPSSKGRSSQPGCVMARSVRSRSKALLAWAVSKKTRRKHRCFGGVFGVFGLERNQVTSWFFCFLGWFLGRWV